MTSKAKTYYPAAGVNFIQDNELINVNRILTVHRSGGSRDPGYSNLGFSYSAAEGKIFFNPEFETGESARVWFVPGTGPVITCTPISGTPSLPPGVVGIAYYYAYAYSGTLPLALTVNTKPSWMTVTLAGNQVIFTGSPDVAGTPTVDITLTNCSGGSSVNFVGTITVSDPPPPDPTSGAMKVMNNSNAFAKILNVSNFTYTISTGAFPLKNGESLVAVFNSFITAIHVKVKTIFSVTLTVRKNGLFQESKSLSFSVVDQNVSFIPIPYNNGDLIEIELNLT